MGWTVDQVPRIHTIATCVLPSQTCLSISLPLSLYITSQSTQSPLVISLFLSTILPRRTAAGLPPPEKTDHQRSVKMSSGSCSETGADDSFMLFGVRVRLDPMRKSVSMNNLSQYELPQESSNVAAADVAADCASADEAVHNQSSGSRERKRGQSDLPSLYWRQLLELHL